MAWRLMVSAALEGAQKLGYSVNKRPGRGLSNTYELTKDGKTVIAAVRTTQDRWIAFPPLNDGKNWKTLDDVDLVLVASVDDRIDPQYIDVYIFSAQEVRRRFNASYTARIQNGHTVRNNYGMWVLLDKGDDNVVSQVGHGLAEDFDPITRFSIDKLERSLSGNAKILTNEASPAHQNVDAANSEFPLETVASVLTFAREKIASLTGMSIDAVKLDLKMGL